MSTPREAGTEREGEEMISNPARFFINGSEDRQFTHEGGAKLFHWSPYESDLSNSMESNVVFFADSMDHARDVLRRMFEFWIECDELYLASKKNERYDHHGFMDARRTEITTLRFFLKNLSKMSITEAPTNQFYKVGWACNDGLNVYQPKKVTKREKDAELISLSS